MTTTLAPRRLRWRTGLTIVLALLYGWVGLASAGLERMTGLLGAAAILAALVVAGRSRSGAIVLLLAGAVPLAVLSWWSVVTPILAVLCLLFGWPRPGVPARRSC